MRPSTLCIVAAMLGGCLAAPGPSPATGQSFVEGFDAGESLPPGWVPKQGDWTLEDRLDAPSSPHVLVGGPASQILVDGRGTYATLTASVLVDNLPASRWAILVHAIGPTTHHRFEVDGQDLRWIESFEGTERVLAQTTWPGISEDGVEVRLVIKSDSLAGSIGNTTLEAVPPRLNVGHVGLWVAEGRIGFDDVSVTRTT